jgi:hypothetical protein
MHFQRVQNNSHQSCRHNEARLERLSKHPTSPTFAVLKSIKNGKRAALATNLCERSISVSSAWVRNAHDRNIRHFCNAFSTCSKQQPPKLQALYRHNEARLERLSKHPTSPTFAVLKSIKNDFYSGRPWALSQGRSSTDKRCSFRMPNG